MVLGQRGPTKFKTNADITAVNTTVWTPAAGKRYRLLGGVITLSKEAAAATGPFSLQLEDLGTNAQVIANFQVSHAVLVPTGQVEVFPFNFGGNGYQAGAPDNTLRLSMNDTLTAGSLSFVLWGTEE